MYICRLGAILVINIPDETHPNSTELESGLAAPDRNTKCGSSGEKSLMFP
jgi:hypothetical protein